MTLPSRKYIWQNYGSLWHFCKNPICPDPIWKPVIPGLAQGAQAGRLRGLPGIHYYHCHYYDHFKQIYIYIYMYMYIYIYVHIYIYIYTYYYYLSLLLSSLLSSLLLLSLLSWASWRPRSRSRAPGPPRGLYYTILYYTFFF